MRADKLFYAVVVLGASITGGITGGCGAATDPEDEDAAVADAGEALDSGAPTDAGEEEDGMVLIL